MGEVAAVMRPADQVGGDYYDVFDVGGVEWVLIGDVSGHGVPAGLSGYEVHDDVAAVSIKQRGPAHSVEESAA